MRAWRVDAAQTGGIRIELPEMPGSDAFPNIWHKLDVTSRRISLIHEIQREIEPDRST
jgi:hypothetical protein